MAARGIKTFWSMACSTTMCANEGTAEDRRAIIRALHHLQ